MLKFKDFLYFNDLSQFLTEGIEDHQPQDGKWITQVGDDPSTYKFNIPNDDCGSPDNPCYAVNIYGDPSKAVSISFSRDGTYTDQHLGVGLTVFKGVLKALNDYIKVVKPEKITWNAVRKNIPNPKTGRINNPEARSHIYEGWAVRHLFPEYIGQDELWIRRDIYDSKYVTLGYAPVPEGVNNNSSPVEKTRALEQMKKDSEAAKNEIDRKRNELEIAERARQQAEFDRRQAEAEAARQELARRVEEAINDEQKNPHRLKRGDIVYLVGHVIDIPYNIQDRPGKITYFKLLENDEESTSDLYATVIFSDQEDHETREDSEFNGPSYKISVKKIQKKSPELDAERERNRQNILSNLISNPQINPHDLREGDDIITSIPGASADNEQNGLLGKITRFKRTDSNQLMAYVVWDDHAKQILRDHLTHPVNVKFIKKSTPEDIQNIQKIRRDREIESQVQARQQMQARQMQARQNQSELGEEFINHPSNPERFRPGDLIKMNGWQNRGRRGVIVSLEKPHWSEHVSANIRFHGSRAARPTRVWNLVDLERDVSQQAQAIQTRQQRSQERQQRIASGTNGLQIGDTVTVSSGVHRGKTGRIINFRNSGQNVLAVIAAHEGNFNVNVRTISNTQHVAAESLSFFRYYLDKNEII